MRIALTDRFQRGVRALADDQRARVFDVMLSLPSAMGQPHRHLGAGLRKLHASGIWEARVGLGLRLVLAIEKDTLTLVTVGTHDEIKRYLRSV